MSHRMQTKYVVVLGSLLSGLGKGIVTSSVAKLLTMHNYNVMPLKFDGYLNYDCGTMNPFRHGEVFVLEDGGEVDMDFGTYERFLNKNVNKSFSLTGGKLFTEIIARERKGDFLGADVQIIPHLTDYIIERITSLAEKEKLDVLVIEVGGTVGDIENSYFVEAMRQLSVKNKVAFVDVTYVPELETVGEQKTKPTQLALRSLRQEGVQPDFIICRSTRALDEKARRKIALFSNLQPDRVLDDHDTKNIYELPDILLKQGFDKMIIDELGLELKPMDEKKLAEWRSCFDGRGEKKPLTIGVVGKYVNLHDSYASVTQALHHAALHSNADLRIKWLESEAFENAALGSELAMEQLKDCDGILVPGGFGARGTEGMIKAIEYARVNKVPYLGLCLGMQLMVIEHARNMANIKDASSSEFTDSGSSVIDLMDEQKGVKEKGGSMRLGAWEAKIKPGTVAHAAYGAEQISERHRHRYEFNNLYRQKLEDAGLVISATTTDGKLVEIVEWKGQFGVGTQAHPEFKSRVEKPSPLFLAFVRSALAYGKGEGAGEEIRSYNLLAGK